MSWGRGWEVGVRKAIHDHEKTQAQAARILEAECGTRHARGSRKDLCPRCKCEHPSEDILELGGGRRRATCNHCGRTQYIEAKS